MVYQDVEPGELGQPRTIEPLVLDAYDILRVCSEHQHATISNSEISLPLKDLHVWIKRLVRARRAELLSLEPDKPKAKKTALDLSQAGSGPPKKHKK